MRVPASLVACFTLVLSTCLGSLVTSAEEDSEFLLMDNGVIVTRERPREIVTLPDPILLAEIVRAAAWPPLNTDSTDELEHQSGGFHSVITLAVVEVLAAPEAIPSTIEALGIGGFFARDGRLLRWYDPYRGLAGEALLPGALVVAQVSLRPRNSTQDNPTVHPGGLAVLEKALPVIRGTTGELVLATVDLRIAELEQSRPSFSPEDVATLYSETECVVSPSGDGPAEQTIEDMLAAYNAVLDRYRRAIADLRRGAIPNAPRVELPSFEDH